MVDHLLPVPPERPHVARHEIAVEIESVQLPQARPAIDAAARHRVRLAMRMLHDRILERPLPAGLELVFPFAEVPPVVRALPDDVDLLPLVLPDVRRPEL